MGENLKVVWAEFSTLGWVVLLNVYNSWPIQTMQSLDLKTWPRFRPVSLSLSRPESILNKISIFVNFSFVIDKFTPNKNKLQC